MKKTGLIYLFLLFILSGCDTKVKEEQEIYYVYYLNKDHITSVAYDAKSDPEDKEAMTKELLNELAGQGEGGEHSPVIFPFSVLGYTFLQEQVMLNLSQEYRNLDPIKEVLTRAALVKTLTQIEGITYVTIQVNGEDLMDNSQMVVGIMTADTFIDNTGEEMKNYEETELTLYFADLEGKRLVKVNRKLVYNTNISKEKLVVEQLIKGPLEQKGGSTEAIQATIHPQTRILSINVKDGICYINLDNSFLTSVYSANADLIIYSLVNSLTELPSVTKVQIAVEGETKINFQGKHDFSTLFEANYDLLKEEKEREAIR